jgi:hypothetical protein
VIRKLSFLAGLGAGYVLGAKAGTQRYDEIVGKARELAGMPAVQEATSTLSAAAGSAAEKAKSKVEGMVDLTGSSTPPASTTSAGTSSASATTGKARPVAGATASSSAPDVAAR